jgi:hypothetical protein
VPDAVIDFQITASSLLSERTILVHQLLSERRFFAQFVGTRSHPSKSSFLPARSRS